VEQVCKQNSKLSGLSVWQRVVVGFILFGLPGFKIPGASPVSVCYVVGNVLTIPHTRKTPHPVGAYNVRRMQQSSWQPIS
jgi:hypothetical protein